jgi:hypothetical protein
MSSLYRFVRSTLVVWITAVVAALYLINQYTTAPITNQLGFLSGWGAILTSFMTIIAYITYIRFHARRIMQKSERWYFSPMAIFIAIATVVIGQVLPLKTKDPTYIWLYFNIILTLFLASMSMRFFIQVAAIFRAFRAKTIESALLLITTVIMVLATMPYIVGNFPAVNEFGMWILNHPSRAANRAGIIVSAIGATGMAIRVWLGKERGLKAG